MANTSPRKEQMSDTSRKSPLKLLLSNISKYSEIFLYSWIWSRNYETISVSVNDVPNLLWLYQVGFPEVEYMVTDECHS